MRNKQTDLAFNVEQEMNLIGLVHDTVKHTYENLRDQK